MDKSWEPQKRKKGAGGRKSEPKENWVEGIQRSRRDRNEKEGGRGRKRERKKLEVTTDICEICLKYFKPSRDLPVDLPQLIAQRIQHRTKPFP